ncbi:MAG: hypothetical protein ACOC0A_01860 [Planctomycetota bacterium]
MNKLLAQEHTIVWHNPDDRFYVEGCGLANLGGGDWLGVVPVVPRDCEKGLRAQLPTQSRIHIVRSIDGGASWNKVSELPYYSAVPFLHNGAVYLFANKGGTEFRNDDLLLLRSDDDGATWSEPVTLFEGHFWNCHTGMTVKDNNIYWAVDDLSFGMQFRGPRVVVGDLGLDIMSPEAWRLSNPVPYFGLPDVIKDPEARGVHGRCLEPNVIDVYGRLRVLSRVWSNGLCAVYDISDDGRKVELDFVQYHPMKGAGLKFCVVWDEVSGLFWATTNPSVNSQELVDWSGIRVENKGYKGGDRRFLMLYYSLDGLNWVQAGCVAQAPKLWQSFGYPTLTIDGNDLGIIARSNINGPNPHDADCATFHRVKNFRDLTMDLTPERG